MKITDVSVVYVEYPLPKPMFDATHYIPARGALVVQVNTDGGLVGIGEAAIFGSGWPAVKASIEQVIAPLVVGRDPLNREQIWDTVYKVTAQHGRRGVGIMALSGLDIALWDITAKACSVPLYKLLGGFDDSIPAYASCGFYQLDKPTEALVAEVDRGLKQGFQAVKIKVGRNLFPTVPRPSDVPQDTVCRVSENEDIQRVESVREHVGDDFPLIIDANGSWEPGIALRMARSFAEFNPLFLEEPVSIDNAAAGGTISKSSGVPVAGYETEFTRYGFRDLIVQRVIDVVQPDLTWAGGISEVLRIAALAEAHGLPVIPHCFSSAICLTATAHFLAGRGSGKLLEFDITPNALRTELLKEPIEISSDGRVHLSDKPGLGIEINQDVLNKYAVSD